MPGRRPPNCTVASRTCRDRSRGVRPLTRHPLSRSSTQPQAIEGAVLPPTVLGADVATRATAPVDPQALHAGLRAQVTFRPRSPFGPTGFVDLFSPQIVKRGFHQQARGVHRLRFREELTLVRLFGPLVAFKNAAAAYGTRAPSPVHPTGTEGIIMAVGCTLPRQPKP
ncbi:hypothetical protein K439DRAFT_1612941 [Ramaria rubella]|nr:hypothetical protein K439DRAFT_1612941 [Ramaria rubella]